MEELRAGGPIHGVRAQGRREQGRLTSETKGSTHTQRKMSEDNTSVFFLFLNHRGYPPPPGRNPTCLAT